MDGRTGGTGTNISAAGHPGECLGQAGHGEWGKGEMMFGIVKRSCSSCFRTYSFTLTDMDLFCSVHDFYLRTHSAHFYYVLGGLWLEARRVF